MDEFVTLGEAGVDSAGAIKVDALQPDLTEDLALALLKRLDLQPEWLASLSKNSALLKSRKVRLAVVKHPRTPRHVLLPLLRHLFTFDLMRVALMPSIPVDIKVAAEESLIHRLEKLPLGEKLSLARRASGRVAAALLRDSEPRVIDTALQNGRLTESGVIKQLSRQNANPHLVKAICSDPKWSVRSEIARALLQKAADNSVLPTRTTSAATAAKADPNDSTSENVPG